MLGSADQAFCCHSPDFVLGLFPCLTIASRLARSVLSFFSSWPASRIWASIADRHQLAFFPACTSFNAAFAVELVNAGNVTDDNTNAITTVRRWSTVFVSWVTPRSCNVATLIVNRVLRTKRNENVKRSCTGRADRALVFRHLTLRSEGAIGSDFQMVQILVIEDEPAFRSVVVDTLIRNGYAVIEAEDGRAGLALLKTNAVDVIITDVLMPDVDGIEVIMKLREAKSSIPIIAMTGRPEDADVYLNVAKALGAQRVLMKPFAMDDLLKIVREVSPTER